MYNIYSCEPSNFNARGDESIGCLLNFTELINSLFSKVLWLAIRLGILDCLSNLD